MNMRRFRAVICVAMMAAVTGACTSSETAKRRYFDAGNAHFAKKEYQDAIIDYRNALQKDAKFGDARMRLAETYERVGDIAGAAREYARAADLLPANDAVLVKAGEYRLLAGRFEDAKALASKVIARSPANVNARILMGNALAGLKDFAAAIAQMQEAATVDPTRVSPAISIGHLELARGDKAEAEASFGRALQIDPKSSVARMALASFYVSDGRVDEAESTLREGLALDPNDVQANRAMAGFYLQTRRVAEAEPFLKAAADALGDGPSGLALADYYAATRREGEARAILERLSAKPEVFVDAKTRIASLAWRASRKDEAYAAVGDALRRDPRSPMALLTRGGFLVADRKSADAIKDLKTAVSVSPRLVDGHLLLATAYRDANDLDAAVKEYEEVLKLRPAAIAANYALAVLSLSRGKAESALQYAQQASKASPNGRDVGLVYIRALVATRALSQAESQARLLLQLYPKDADVNAAMGTVLAVSGKPADARRQYEAALAASATNMEAIGGLVRLDLQSDRMAQALQRLEARVALTPADPEVLVLAARSYLQAKDPLKAESLLQRAIAADGSRLEAYDMLGRIYVALRRLPVAQQQFEAIVQRQPRSVSAWTMLAILNEMGGRTADAEKAYEKALDIDPQAGVASNNLAWLYATSGRNLDVALQLAQTAKSRMPDEPSVSDTLGWIYLQKSLLAQALPALEESVRHVPGNPEFQFHLGLAQAKAGNVQAAREALQQALKLNSTFNGADEARRTLATLGTVASRSSAGSL
jgi:tetratricopeptide (TPR) repeat protein